MNPWQNQDGSDTQLGMLYRIGKDQNPIQKAQYQQLLQQAGLPDNASPSSFSSDQAMGNAKAAQAMQLQANQPAIQTLQTQYNPDTGGGALVDKYNALLDSITASEQPALNSTIQAANNELGKRGISGDSGVAQNQIAAAQLPVATQFGQLKASTGVAQQQDLGQLASNIAGLRAGNVPGALNFGQGIAGQQEALSQAQLQAANNIALQKLANTGQIANTQQQQKFYTTSPGQNLVNTFNNTAVNPSMLTSAGGGVASLR